MTGTAGAQDINCEPCSARIGQGSMRRNRRHLQTRLLPKRGLLSQHSQRRDSQASLLKCSPIIIGVIGASARSQSVSSIPSPQKFCVRR